jgi:hypothetical protein
MDLFDSRTAEGKFGRSVARIPCKAQQATHGRYHHNTAPDLVLHHQLSRRLTGWCDRQPVFNMALTAWAGPYAHNRDCPPVPCLVPTYMNGVERPKIVQLHALLHDLNILINKQAGRGRPRTRNHNIRDLSDKSRRLLDCVCRCGLVGHITRQCNGFLTLRSTCSLPYVAECQPVFPHSLSFSRCLVP